MNGYHLAEKNIKYAEAEKNNKKNCRSYRCLPVAGFVSEVVSAEKIVGCFNFC